MVSQLDLKWSKGNPAFTVLHNFQANNLSFNFTPGDDFIWLSVPTGNDNDYIKFLACLEISLASHRVCSFFLAFNSLSKNEIKVLLDVSTCFTNSIFSVKTTT